MKLVLAIVKDDDTKHVIKRLMKDGFQVTKLASTGGFLKVGSTTLLMGVRNERVGLCLEAIKESCSSKRISSSKISGEVKDVSSYTQSFPSEIIMGGATVFVLNIEDFQKF